MPYKIDEVNGYLGLLHTIAAFAAGWPERGTITESKTGNGLLKYVLPVSASTPLETWTVVCTTGGGDGVAVFSVTGSSSGAQANATAGVRYDNGIVTFKITGPSLYNCVVSDQFQFTFGTGPMSTASISYVIDRYGNQFTSDAELIMHGIGSGSDEIYIGLKAKDRSGADAYNLVQQGYTGYSAGLLWEEQPGAIAQYLYGGVTNDEFYPPSIAFASEPIEGRLYLTCNSRRIAGCVFFEGYSAPFYLGWMLPYMTPGQWPYPMLIGGSCGSLDGGVSENPQRYSSNFASNSSWFHPNTHNYNYDYRVNNGSSCRVLRSDLTWEGISNAYNRAPTDNYSLQSNGVYYGFTFPYAGRWFEDVEKNIDDSYFLLPIHILSRQSTGDPNGYVHGIPDGCFAISGFDNNQENTFTIGSDLYVVVRNSAHSEIWDYMAIRMDN